ncbi:MAG: hypothetical protein IBJ11_05590 [Phycisphaerales bacterium]|nr:hypothetical protein [Phycisphaerales bacterium]
MTYCIEEPGAGRRYISDVNGADGAKRTEAEALRPEGRGGRGRPRPDDNNRPPPPPTPDDRPPPADPRQEAPGAPSRAPDAAGFTVTSESIGPDGRLSIDCTCDGPAGGTPPVVRWAHPPQGARFLAITLHHVPPPRPGDDPKSPESKHVYWVVYNLPIEAGRLAAGDAGAGKLGVNTVNSRPSYAPPCSKGPGDKVYILTAYALAEPLTFSAQTERRGVTMDDVLAAIGGRSVATANIRAVYARNGGGR